tara:strand:+ start:71 stop:685 length:615 start_codon:yes stop_codon:yes gene_type:complete
VLALLEVQVLEEEVKVVLKQVEQEILRQFHRLKVILEVMVDLLQTLEQVVEEELVHQELTHQETQVVQVAKEHLQVFLVPHLKHLPLEHQVLHQEDILVVEVEEELKMVVMDQVHLQEEVVQLQVQEEQLQQVRLTQVVVVEVAVEVVLLQEMQMQEDQVDQVLLLFVMQQQKEDQGVIQHLLAVQIQLEFSQEMEHLHLKDNL